MQFNTLGLPNEMNMFQLTLKEDTKMRVGLAIKIGLAQEPEELEARLQRPVCRAPRLDRAVNGMA